MSGCNTRGMIVVAIDPGLNGGVAILNSDGELEAFDIPTVGEKAKRRVFGATLSRRLVETNVTHAVIEQVSAMPKQGIASAFRFGTAYGQCLGVIEALWLPLTVVHSSKWKRQAGLDSSKENSRLKAIETFPKYEHFFTRKRDHNRAEAALLANWYFRTEGA